MLAMAAHNISHPVVQQGNLEPPQINSVQAGISQPGDPFAVQQSPT